MQEASESFRFAHQIESLAGQAFAENTLARTLLSFGEFGPGTSHAQEASRIATEIEHQQWMVASLSAFGHIYVLLLAPALAINALEAGLSRASVLGSTFWMATLATPLGRAFVLNHGVPSGPSHTASGHATRPQPRKMAEREIALAWGNSCWHRERRASRSRWQSAC